MDTREFQRLAETIPKPTVDAIHVHSRQEIVALSEFTKKAKDDHLPPYLRWTHALGIPVYVVQGTPPGILRAMLGGEVVKDHPIR